MKSTACLQGVPSWLCSVRFFDEAIDLAVRCTTAGRQITAVLTDALATKLHGDPRSEYRLEWTEEERLDSAFLVVSALHMGTNESVSPESLEVSTGFCHLRVRRQAPPAPHVSAHTNNLVRRIAVSERAGNWARLLRLSWVVANSTRGTG